MKKRLRQKIPKLRSKKGLTLVEILVGVVIIVIVFGATLSAMVHGFSKTLRNADTNKSAVEGGSVNEVIMEAIKKQKVADEIAAETLMSTSDNPVHAAANAACNGIVYVENPSDFPKSEYDNQYTIVFNASSDVTTTSAKKPTIKQMEIITSVMSSDGTVINRSYVSYNDQTPG